MRTMIRSLVGLCLIAMLAAPAFAQGRGGFGRFGGGSLAGLLGNASVQKELKLDDEQIGKAKEVSEKISGEIREKSQGLQDLSPDEQREKRMAITKEFNEATIKAAGAFLKPEQIARLKQVSYQAQGAMAFRDPEVISKLNLTDSQKSDIQAINQESMSQMREIFQSAQDDREGAMKKMTELRKETLEKVAAKLNDEQQKSWKELIGAPFEVKYEPRPQ
jgi:hypothetical protein